MAVSLNLGSPSIKHTGINFGLVIVGFPSASTGTPRPLMSGLSLDTISIDPSSSS